MGWKHQAVFPSGKSYGPTLTQHPKVPKVYPARGGQRFAVVCPAVLTLNETCTCAPSPRGVDQVGAGSSRSCAPPWKSTWDPLSFYLKSRCLFNRGHTPITPSTSLNQMNLLQNGSGTWFLPAWHPQSGPFMMTLCIATAGPLPHLTSRSTAYRYLCTVSEDGVMCIQCKGEIIGRLLQLRDRWSVQQFWAVWAGSSTRMTE